MVFTFEALQAFYGDCLLVHAGPADQPHLVLIDGGPSATYATSLAPRLEQVRVARGGEEPIPLAMILVSHIDGDHIQGIIQLAGALVQAKQTKQPLTVTARTLWHNAFDDVLSHQVADITKAAARGQLAGANADVQAVIASVPEGRVLRDLAATLGWSLNRPLDDLITADRSQGPLTLGDGIEITVVGPTQAQLDALYDEWERWLAKARRDPLRPATITDTSVFNRSSIVLLVEAGGKRMLLTGDARGDHIATGLDRVGTSRDGVTEVEILKLPHHGSARNIDERFFEALRARHYVISANGRFGNPDEATLDMLMRIRHDDDFAIHLTNRDGVQPDGSPLRSRLDAWHERTRSAGRRFEVNYRADQELALRIDLADPLPGSVGGPV